MNPRRLYRSRDRMLAGVAGGMAEYLDIDPTVIRILWVIVVLATGGLALLAYLVLALVMPQAPYAAAPGTGAWGAPPAAPAPPGGWDAATASGPYAGSYSGPYAGSYAQPGVTPAAPPRSESRGIGAAAIVGVVLIVFGAIALADAALPGWVAGAILGPAVILTLGAALLASSLRWRRDEAPRATAAPAAATAPAYATPTVPGMPETPAAPWDVTDTQAVDPAVPDAPDQGARSA